MSVVFGRSPVRNVTRADRSTPGDVLFKRGVKVACVAATGGQAVVSGGPASDGVGPRVGQGVPVRHILSVLRGAGRCVRSVESASSVEPTLSAPVASAYLSRAYPNLRMGSPASMLPLVLRSLRRRAAAVKVLRGRRRLGVATEREELRLELRPLCLPAANCRFQSVALASGVHQLRELSATGQTLQ